MGGRQAGFGDAVRKSAIVKDHGLPDWDGEAEMDTASHNSLKAVS
jgi:hypothetical protein